MHFFPPALALSLAASALIAGSAQAGDFFLGAAIGGAYISEDDFLISDTSYAFKLSGGYHFNDHVAIEAAFLDFDEVVEVVNLSSESQRAVADGEGLTLAGVAQFPIGRFAVTGKAGLFFWNLDETGLDGDAHDEDGADLFLGIGGRFSLNDHLALQLDLERYDFNGVEANVVLLGLHARF